MKINIEVAYLNGSFNLAGKNFGGTVEKSKISDLEMVYYQEEKELWVTYKKRLAIVPSTSFVSVIPEQLASVVPIPQAAAQGKVKAQASSPTDHVFASGPGKTNDR